MAAPAPGAQPAQLEVAADSSLKFALSDLADAYASEPGHPVVQLNLAPSGVIREQIERGGCAMDVFVASSPGEVEKLSSSNLTFDDTVRTLAENEIVMVASWAQGDPSVPWDFLARYTWERIAVANPEKSMSGVAARRLFEALGITEHLHGKLLYENDSNRVLEKVKRAQVAAGIVYRSDVVHLRPRETFRVFDLPRTNQPPIVYCAVVLRNTKAAEAARAFVDFLHAPTNQPVWAKWGFAPLEESGTGGAVPEGPEAPDRGPVPPAAAPVMPAEPQPR